MRAFLIAIFVTAVVASSVVAVQLPDSVAKIKSSYQGQADKIDADYKSAKASIHANYVQQLAMMERKMQQAGDLKGLLAVRAEKVRYLREAKIHAKSVVSEPAELKNLQEKYRKLPGEQYRKRSESRGRLDDLYMTKLESVMKDLTRKGQVEEALAVQAEVGTVKARIEAEKPKPPVPAHSVATTGGDPVAQIQPSKKNKKGAVIATIDPEKNLMHDALPMQCTSEKTKDGYLLTALTDNGCKAVRTKERFKLPIIINTKVKFGEHGVRLYYGKGQVQVGRRTKSGENIRIISLLHTKKMKKVALKIGKLGHKKWHDVNWSIRKDGMVVRVDGKKIYSSIENYGKIKPQWLGIGPGNKIPVEVRSLTVSASQ